MKANPGPLEGLIIIEPAIHADDRGYFFETFQQQRYDALNLPRFVQDNHSHSKKNVLRGLHYQSPHGQGKLVGVTRGKVWDVAVDIRAKSPTFGQWFGIILDDHNHTQMYIPPGFAHGFCVLSEAADFYYKCTDYYAPTNEHGIAWNDTQLNIDWPITQPILSEKDQSYAMLRDIPHDTLFA